MHNYLKTIGFSKLQKKTEEWELLDRIEKNPDERVSVLAEEGVNFQILKKEFADGMGIVVCGSEADGVFHREYYYPYAYGSVVSMTEPCMITKQTEKNAYIGSCDDDRLGASIIFYLSNPEEFIKKRLQLEKVYPVREISLTAMCLSATVLFPIEKSEEEKDYAKEEGRKRIRLIQEAKTGDDAAIDELTAKELDVMSSVNQLLMKEDIYSIVDTFLLPYAVECDQYLVMGEIKKIERADNRETGEFINRILITCNQIDMTLIVAEKDIKGYPKPGRRIKAQIWLQGTVQFRG